MNDEVAGIFISLLMIAIVIFVVCFFEQEGDLQAYLACIADDIPADRDLTYMYGIWTERAICVTQDEVQLNMEEWKEND